MTSTPMESQNGVDGALVGTFDGDRVGISDGVDVESLGWAEGDPVGPADGLLVGTIDGGKDSLKEDQIGTHNFCMK